MFFARNVRRNGRKAHGNFAFRNRRKVTRLALNHRIDLNPETPATRRQKRLRTAGAGVKAAAVLLFLMGLVSAGKIVVKEAFVNNPRFLLQHISVTTDEVAGLTPSQIVETSGLKEGMNMLSVSLVQVKEKIAALPEVRSVKVTRGYPGILFLDVRQRRPVAWLECKEMKIDASADGHGVLLDGDGYVMPSGEAIAGLAVLPVVEVPALERLALGQKVESPNALAALEFLQKHETGGLGARMQVEKVDARRDFVFDTVYHDGLRVLFPRRDVEGQMKRLEKILTVSEQNRWRIGKVNLLVEHNVPVTFLDNNAADLLEQPAKPREALARTQ